MILKDKKFLITGILTDKSIAYASAKIAIENGATVVATGFGKGLRITERAVKRLSDDIKVCLLYTSPSPRDGLLSRMPSSA